MTTPTTPGSPPPPKPGREPAPPLEKPAERATREWATRPTAARRPDLYAEQRLADLGDVRNSTAAHVAAVRALDLELAAAQANVARLPDAASDPRTRQHADARAALDQWLAPQYRDEPARLVELPHAPGCEDDRREFTENRAQTPYGLSAVRVWRCTGCAAQAVVGRRVTLPPDRDAERLQAALEARETARGPRHDPKPWRRSA